MRERRREIRRWTKEWAKILLLDGETVLNCTIINVSPNGACLRVGLAQVPDRFYVFRKSDRSLREAEVKGRRYQTVGVLLSAPLCPECDATQAILAPLRRPTAQAGAGRKSVRRVVDHRPTLDDAFDANALASECDPA